MIKFEPKRCANPYCRERAHTPDGYCCPKCRAIHRRREQGHVDRPEVPTRQQFNQYSPFCPGR